MTETKYKLGTFWRRANNFKVTVLSEPDSYGNIAISVEGDSRTYVSVYKDDTLQNWNLIPWHEPFKYTGEVYITKMARITNHAYCPTNLIQMDLRCNLESLFNGKAKVTIEEIIE